MPGKTQADRLLELEKVVPSILKQLETTDKSSDVTFVAGTEIPKRDCVLDTTSWGEPGEASRLA